MASFEIAVISGNNTLQCILHTSRFDTTITEEFKQEIESHWTPEIEQVILDFQEVDFIDSSGVGALLALQKRITASEKPVLLKNAGKNVVEVIELLRLHRIFNINPVES